MLDVGVLMTASYSHNLIALHVSVYFAAGGCG